MAEEAKVLGMSRQALNNLVKGRVGISAEIAIRIDKAFSGGADTWLGMQAAYDLARAQRIASMLKVRRVTVAEKKSQSRSGV